MYRVFATLQGECPMNKDAIIRTNNLSKWYGDVIGLNSFDVEISPGITGIVGPNGAGKTTFFKLVMGLLKPSQGKISVFGEHPWQNTRIHQKMGFCPDYDTLPDYSSGKNFLRLIGGLYGIPSHNLFDRISEVAEVVGMKAALHRKIKGYSKGMRQRIKIAASMIHNPELLILDEPLSGTDPLIRRELISVIHSLYTEFDHHIIVSSHILPEIERITQEIILIYKGRAVASGNISEIRDLIDKHPHRIRLTGEHMRRLGKRLLDESFTVSVRILTEKDGLTVEVSDPSSFFQSLPHILTETDCSVSEMYSLDDDLEAVFQYLVG